jgi:uncharacterized protein DUF4349
MTPKAIKGIRWGIVSVLVLAVAALAVGSTGSKKTPNATFSHTGAEVGTSGSTATAGSTTSGKAVGSGASGTTTQPLLPNVVAAPDVSNADASDLPSIPDRIARTADLTVEVKKGQFDSAWTAAFRVAQRYSGQIMSSTRGAPTPQPVPLRQNQPTQTSGSDEPAFGDIRIRVPASAFPAATNALRALGIVRGDNTTTEDVSQEYVDLQSRLRNLRAEQNVLLALFDRAKTIKDTLAVQGQLSNVEGQIEQITGRIKYLDARTVFSTVTIHLQEPGVITVLTPANKGPSFGQAWDTTKTGLVRIAGASMILGLWLAPFALLGLIGLAVWRRARGPAPQV